MRVTSLLLAALAMLAGTALTCADEWDSAAEHMCRQSCSAPSVKASRDQWCRRYVKVRCDARRRVFV